MDGFLLSEISAKELRAMSDELCELTEAYNKSAFSRGVELVTVLNSFIGFIVLISVFARKKKLTAHPNFKVIITNLAIVILIQTSTNMISNLVIFIRAFVYIEYCTNVYPFWLGALLKWPLTWTTTTLTMLHFFICIERIMARMYKDDYERKGRGFGMTAVLVAWLVTILINYELCKPPSFTYRMPYCDSQIMKDQPKAAYVSMVLFGIEMITTFSDLMLQYFNKKSAQIIFDRYSLSRSYQIRENYFTSRLVFPVACAHSALYVLYLLCSFIAKNLQAINEDKVFSRSLVISIHNFAILSCTVSMLVYCNRLEAFGKQRELCETAYSNAIATKLYFNQLELQFDEAHSNKPKQSRMGISPTRSI